MPKASVRIPFTKDRFYAEFLPVLLLWYTLGVLVQIPNTRKLRLSILAVIGALAWRVATRYDYDPSPEPGNNWVSFSVCWFLSFMMLRAIDFATSKQFKRIQYSILPPDASVDFITQLGGAMWNAFDLLFNARGIGWDWGKHIYVPPKEPGEGSSSTATSAIGHLIAFVQVQVLFDFVLFAQQSWTLHPSHLPTHPAGGTIFDPTLPPLLRYGKVVAMTFLCPLGLCCSFQATYNAVAAFSIGILRQRPEQWPPLFHAPWRATSLADFWGVRWHQVFKRAFVVSGAKPAARIAGRAGGVIGAFFVSGLMHDMGVWGAGMGTDLGAITLFFTMMGVGCAIEGLFKQYTGIKVRGPVGWAWAMVWMFFWGSWIVDAWARRGLIISHMSPPNARPALYWAKVVQKWISLYGEPLA